MNISRAQWLFATKVYIAAMLAYFISAQIGLSNPYWAMVTCCVLSNPLSGMLRARSVYRFIGTISAGALSLALSAWLANDPIVLVIVTGLVSSAVLALAFADRTPGTYSFQLAGATLMLVLVAYLDQPEHMFTMVITRVTEISIGILSISFIDALWKPGSVQPVVQARANQWLADLQKWRSDILTADMGSRTEADRIKMLNDVTSMSQLASTMKYDYSLDKQTRQAIIALQRKVMVIIPRISAIEDAMNSLSRDMRNMIAPYFAQFQTTDTTAKLPQVGIPHSIYEQATPWEQLVLEQLEQLFNQHGKDWAEAMAYKQIIDGKRVSVETRYRAMKAKAFPLPSDKGLMMRMFGGILLTYSLLSAMWFMTGWVQGPTLVLLGVVAISFFGATDEPGTTISLFGHFTFFSFIGAFILGYILLPLANSETSFFLVMAIYMIPMGIWAAKNPLALLALALSLSNINFQGHYAPFEISFFLESMIAALIGIYVAFVSVAIVRRWGAASALKDLSFREHKDRLSLYDNYQDDAIETYVVRSLDRMALQTARLGVDIKEESLILLEKLRANVYTARLKQLTQSSLMSSEVEQLIQQLKPSRKDGNENIMKNELLTQIDHCLQQALERKESRILSLLTGLRIALFPKAKHWSPASCEVVRDMN